MLESLIGIITAAIYAILSDAERKTTSCFCVRKKFIGIRTKKPEINTSDKIIETELMRKNVTATEKMRPKILLINSCRAILGSIEIVFR